MRKVTDYSIATGVPKNANNIAKTRLRSHNQNGVCDYIKENGQIATSNDPNLKTGYFIAILVKGSL